MQLYSQQPFWLVRDGMIASYNSLDKNISVDVAIIGAGISGALAAYYLRNTGLSVAVIERRHVGIGSTAASTAFLQYEIDTPLAKLCNYVGFKNAVRSYQLCREAIYTIESICKSLKPEFDFHIRPSLQYASFKKDVKELHNEYRLRKQCGFDVSWLEPGDLQKKFGITAPGGLLSKDGGEVDAYMLTHALLMATHRRGHGIYTNTNVTAITHQKRGATLLTDRGNTIKAKNVIIACGYESMKYLPKQVAQVHSTYAIVSEPVSTASLWQSDSLVWETANPYMYFRKVDKDRILVGGKDDEFHHPNIRSSTIRKKAQLLENSFNKRVPHLSIRTDYCWGGAFAVTKDGLPYIGKINQFPHTYFALGYGGNGITFSVIAAQILRDQLLGKNNKDAHIFNFSR